jgi:hypothetical protein
LGFALQSFILPRSRAALLDSTALCSLAVSVATANSDAKTPAISDRFPPLRRTLAGPYPREGVRIATRAR